MEREIFGAGVAPGAPATGGEIRMLICYLLAEIEKPLLFEDLHEALRENELVNYFELVAAVERLKDSGHIEAVPENGAPETFSVTELGRATATELTSSLPLAVREKALASVKKINKRKQRLREVNITETAVDSGFIMEFSIPDSQLLSLRVFAPSKLECDVMRRRFLNDPLFIYKASLALLTGDQNVLGDIFPSAEKLF